MSATPATQFIQKIFEDATLREKLNAQVGDIAHVDLSTNVPAGENIVKIGQEWGYKFDVADLQGAYRDFVEQNLNSSRGVLSESELELVAGGLVEASLCTNTLCASTC